LYRLVGWSESVEHDWLVRSILCGSCCVDLVCTGDEAVGGVRGVPVCEWDSGVWGGWGVWSAVLVTGGMKEEYNICKEHVPECS
jgi:hypothetical protein